ncbi:hypothetical protein TR13x_00610 [Caloranaerobacter sp. TR13]|uniref:alpha/beta-type small acid-soluble spore protein n=1 Tax=Caloranaerobacter TaxID=171003 RepID=UPI0006D3C6FB|nr:MULTISPECIES: alpha/beta-type small acid-soluble spore protein [Caloranaerobacter]KPU27889.1 hypothetical protein TR13x_00610 [Caloranaerobacter sp. TR13]
MARRNRPAPEARQALMELKLEIASELGLDKIHEREDIDPITREVLKNGGKYAGYVGGYMVRRMIEQAERDLANKLK